jgi:TRAP-type C4-dicarboxylate transport system substrate-binding protein
MYLRILLSILVILAGPAQAMAGSVVIKLGTLAPEGSVWHDALLEVRQEWSNITNGDVELRIYAGGVLGGEAEMVRKMQRGGLDAVAITGAGLPHVDGSLDVLNIPLLFESYAELEYVRSRIAPKLERRLAKRRFKVLTWSDAGWVYFFTKSRVRTPDELRPVRLWISSGSPESERLFKQFGFNVVPLPVTDILTALQTGLVEAIDVPPLFALLDRSYQLVPYMIDLRWAPLNGATVLRAQSWRRIPPQHHDALLAAIRGVARVVQADIHHAGEEAIVEMQARGLEVVTLDSAVRAAWRREARAAYPALRENIGLPKLFDEVLRLAEEYKKKNPGGAMPGRTTQP